MVTANGRSGIDINQQEYEFWRIDSWREHLMETALHCMVCLHEFGCVRFLLEKGIDAGLRLQGILQWMRGTLRL